MSEHLFNLIQSLNIEISRKYDLAKRLDEEASEKEQAANKLRVEIEILMDQLDDAETAFEDQAS